MNDKLQQVYDLYKSKGIIKTTDFNTFATADDSQRKKLYDLGVSNGLFKSTDYGTFSTAWGSESKTQTPEKEVVKKKVPTESASKSGEPTLVSSANEVEDAVEARDYSGNKYVAPKQAVPVDATKAPKKTLGDGEILESKNAKYRYSNGKFYGYTDTTFDKKTGAEISNYNTPIKDVNRVKTLEKMFNKAEYVKGYPGKEEKEYRFKYNQWYEDDKSGKGFTPIQDPVRVGALNKQFKKEGSTVLGEKVFVGYPGKESNEYKVSDDGAWMYRPKGSNNWSVITNEGSILSLNKQYGQKVDPKKQDLQNLAVKNAELNDINHKIDAYVTSNLIDDREAVVVDVLSKKFPQFNFEQSTVGVDRMTVSLKGSQDPKDRIEIVLDNWEESDDNLNANLLKSFMKERVNMADSRTNLQEKESPFLTRDIESKQRALEAGSGQKEFEQPELVINKDGSVSYAEKPKTTATQKAVQVIEEKQQLKEARQEYFSDKSNYLKTVKNSYARGEIDNKEFQTAVAAIKVDDKEIKRSDEFINDVNYSRKKLTESQDFQEKYINDVTEKLKSGEITQEQYDAEYQPKIAEMNDSVEKQKEQLKIDNKSIDGSLKAVERAVAENRLVQEQIGSTGGAIAYNAIKMATDLGRLAGLTPEDQEAFIRDNFGIVTTKEFIGSEDRTFLQQAAMSSASTGVAIAAGLVGGAPLALASLWAAGTFEMFDDEELKNVPKRDKFLMSAAYGVVSSYLEKIGLDELVGGEIGKKLAMNVVKDAAKKLTKDAPKEYVENLLISETKSRLQQAGVKIGVGMLAEGTTEALQSLASVSTKEVYDQLKGTEYFNNKTGWEIASDVLYDGALGAVGGGMISSVVTGSQQVVQGRRASKMDAETKSLIAAAETEGMSEAVKTTLKAKIIRGEITKTDAKNILNDFQIIKSKVDQMPNTLTEEGKAASLDLMLEKDKLEKQIEGKDPNLVEPQKKRVNEINDRLKQIGEDAVQKQTTGEVPVQSEAGVGEEVEGGVSQPTAEQVTEEVVGEEVIGKEAQGEQAQAEVAKEEVEVESIAKELENSDNTELKKQLGIESNWDMLGESDFLSGNDPVLAYTQRKLPEWNRESQLGNINPESELTYGIVKGRFGAEDNKNVVTAKDENGVTVGIVELSSNGGIENIAVAPEFRKKEVSNKLIEVLKENNPKLDLSKTKLRSKGFEKAFSNKIIADAYQKAKQDGSNPSLVKAVDDLLAKKPVTEAAPIEAVQEEVDSELNDFESLLTNEGISAPKATEETVVEEKPAKKPRGKKAATVVEAPVTEPSGETGQLPVTEAAPAKKQKAPKKLTLKETIQKYNDHIDSLIKDEKERSDRRIALLANQRNSATGQRRTELTQEMQDLEFAFKAKKRGLESKKDDKQAAVEFAANPARFRMSEGSQEQPDTRNDEQAIIDKMNEASAEEKGLNRGEIPESVEVDPIEESSSLSKNLDKVLKFLGLKDKSELLKPIEFFNGIPMVLGMSDILAAGTIKDSMGNEMKVGGGKLYNLLGENQELAWAGVTENGSDNQGDQAWDVYQANKELFDRLWAEGKIPYGHIPMAIMRMGNTAINSNEAVFRYLLPLVKSLPLKNRTAALSTYMQALQSRAEGNAASYWFTELEEQIETGNLTTKEQVIDYLNNLAEKEQKAHEESKKEGKNAKVTKINSFKNAILKKKDGTFDDVREELTKRLDKIVPFMLMNYIQENKIKTLDGFLEAVVNESKKRAEGDKNIFSLPVRSFIFKSLISPESTKKDNSLKVIKTLLDGVKNADATIFTAKHIYNAIGEKSMLRTNKGDVVAIVGIKVLDENGNRAGGTKKANHNNYGFGPEGRMIALIKNPKPGIDVFPEFRAKLARVFKPSSTGKYPTIEDAVNQTGGAFFMDSAFRGAAPAVDAMTDLKILIGKLRFAFPEVSVATTQEEFDNFLEQEGIRAREKDGKVIYGVTKDGRIFLNPSEQTLRTPIHEFGHIWIDYLRSKESGPKGDMLLQKGFELVDGTPEYKRALKEYGNRELALEEALVELLAVKGDTIASAAKKSQFLEWMNAMFKYIKENLTRSKDFAKSKIKDLTLDEFINIGLADLFSGERVSGKFDARTAGEASRARFSLNANQDMMNIIDLGRQNGYSNDTIKKSLLNRGYKVGDINTALEVKVDALTTLPNEFGNVEGGVTEGRKLFEEVKDDLSAWQSTIVDNTEKSLSETRQKAIELLKANPIFKKQSEQIQNELIVALDKSIGIRANKTIQREIAEIKKSLRQRKIGANNLKDAQQALKAFIRKNLPSSSAYAKSQIEKLISAVNDTTPTNFKAQADVVLGVVEQQREKMKQVVLKSIRTLVTKKAQAAITSSGKRRSGGLDAEGQAFFQAAKPIIKAAIENDVDAMLEIMNELSDTAMIDEVVAKEVAGEKLTSKEEALLNKALAFDTFADIQSMELEEVQKLFDALKDVRTESIKRLKSRRIQRAEENKKNVDQVTDQIKNAYGDTLFRKDGKVKDGNDFTQDQAAIWNSFKEMKILSGIKAWAKRYDFNTVLGIKDFFVNRIAHIGALATILDKGGSFIYDNTYVQLNRMDEADKQGYQNQMENLDSISNSINGITKGYKQVRNSIPNGTFKIKLNGVEKIFNADQLWRVYSLSKNEVQRVKLERMGFDSDKIEEIKSIIGDQAVEFADKLVDYLSNEYYESINNVYSYVNDVNLGYVNNYFPTMTIATKVDGKMLEEGNFNGIFNAETAPAFKERVDQKNDVDLSADFTSVVESHFRAMEKYKAYAEGVKKMNSLFNAPAFNALLEQTRTKNAMKLAINFAINPNAGLKEKQVFIGKAFSKFSGYALAFKVAQIPKQATSFVNAYEDYQFRKGKNTPGLDAIMYMLDTAHTILTLPIQVKKAYNVSANFRDRIKTGVEGDVYGLEAGSRIFKPLSQSNTLLGKLKRLLKSTAAAPTMIGDVLGVMGYMTNYNRNIKNGMSKAEALEAFNNYNATLQSRRSADKAPLQQSQNELVRAFTMFGSTAFLQMNKVTIAYTKIMRDLYNYPTTKKLPSATDIRALALNLGIANALFVLTAYMAKFVVGDDDEEEEVMNEITNALYGLNLLYQLPLIGGAAEEIVNYAQGKRAFTSEVVNPYSSVFRKVKKGFEVEGSNVYDKARPIVELALGAQSDPFIGLYNLYQKDEMDPNDLYDALGIAKTYRPADNEGKNPTEIIKNKMTAAKAKLSKEVKKLKTSISSNGITKEEYKKSMEEVRSEYEERINELRDRLDKIK
jgi:hypothetical protein